MAQGQKCACWRHLGPALAALSRCAQRGRSRREGLDYTFWFGLFAPAGLPQEVTQKLFDASVAALNDPEVKARLEKSGNESAPSQSLAEFRAWALAEGAKSKELTARSGASIE